MHRSGVDQLYTSPEQFAVHPRVFGSYSGSLSPKIYAHVVQIRPCRYGASERHLDWQLPGTPWAPSTNSVQVGQLEHFPPTQAGFTTSLSLQVVHALTPSVSVSGVSAGQAATHSRVFGFHTGLSRNASAQLWHFCAPSLQYGVFASP